MTTRQALKDMIDMVPEERLDDVEQSIRRVMDVEDDPVMRSLRRAPIDDEPLTAEERAAIDEGLRSLSEGRGITTEELKRRLGIQ
jgi:hypothetical protein